MNIFRQIAEKFRGKPEQSIKPEQPTIPAAERDQLREVISYREPAKPEAEILEQEKLLDILSEQGYPSMLDALRQFGIVLDDVPTLEEIRLHLTRPILEKALKLKEPTLLLIPPQTVQQMVEAINSQVGKNELIKSELEYGNRIRDLLSNTKVGDPESWEVAIVEGLQNIPFDQEILHKYNKTMEELRKKYNIPGPESQRYEEREREMYKREGYIPRFDNHYIAYWYDSKYEKLGLDRLWGARPYLALMMKGLSVGKPIDVQKKEATSTVLSGFSEADNSYLYGCYLDGHVVLDGTDYFPATSINVRGFVEVM